MRRGGAAALLMLAACGAAAPPAAVPGGGAGAEDRAQGQAGAFPRADRPVSAIVSPRWSTEDARERVGEADAVMTAAGVRPGMSVADIGAGEGYYTLRLAARVDARGRVLAEDIQPAVRDRLAARVARAGLGQVTVTLGTAADPKLPADSVDRVFLIHMYHEIAAPYAFLWRLRPALRAGGQVAVVDADRPTAQHGTPPALLDCEFAAVGYARVARRDMPAAGGYLALYEARGPRPAPAAIRACAG